MPANAAKGCDGSCQQSSNTTAGWLQYLTIFPCDVVLKYFCWMLLQDNVSVHSVRSDDTCTEIRS